MPIYEFVCSECGHEFEKILSFSATAAPACVKCGAENAQRQMGRPAIHFKGSGWYINDSKKGNGKKGNNNPASGANGDSSDSAPDSPKAESGGAEGGESSESKAAESKPVKKADAEKTSSPAKSEAV